MANRIGDSHKQFVWKMPDRQPDPGEGYISIYLPHPFMRLPSADDILSPIIIRKPPAWILSPRGGKRRPFDTGLIRPGMPTAIRKGFLEQLIRDILKERKRPSPAIKAPPKRSGKVRKEKRKFMGIARHRPAAKTSQSSHGVPAPHAHLAASCPSNAAIPLAIHVSAMTFVRKF